tara:strand:- start:2703 stop:6959 length:4257 start_codon:yes stop_codon:yes gene_type:complete
MISEIPWEIIDTYFKDNKSVLIQHQLNSYNDFFNNGINRIFKEKNPIKILKQQNPETKNYDYRANIYLGGREGKNIYFGKPIIYDDDKEHFMYPNIARLRNMTYAVTIHFDVIIDYIITEDGITNETSSTLEKIYLGRFPIMLNSDLCILNTLSPEVKFNMGECKNDLGGYFIIDGKEKAIISQEKFADNMIYIKDNYNEIYSTSCEVRSVSEDASKPVRTVSIRIVKPNDKLTNNQIVVNIPNVRKAIPLFILMRALGIESDKKIIEYCLLDTEKYKTYIELFIPSIHDAGRIFTQATAIKYISTFTKGKTIFHVLEILMNYFLPHIGDNNFNDKAFYIGHMVKELLKVFTKENKPTDRDSFRFKRVDVAGDLLYNLFKEYYTLQQRNIFQTIDKEYYYKQGIYQRNFTALIDNNYKDIFKDRIVETGFKKAFKGNWGAEAHTKKSGVVQDLNRLSFNSYISHLRKINLPLDASTKIIGPRLLHSSQWGLIDPVDTPDGGNIGLHKHLAMSTYITSQCSKFPLIEFLKSNLNLKLLSQSSVYFISQNTKVFVNGDWVGIIEFPIKMLEKLKNYRRLALIPVYTSILWEKESNSIYIYTDSGRLTRPLFYVEDGITSYRKSDIILNKLLDHKFDWKELITGFNKKKYDINNCNVYQNIEELYGVVEVDSLIKSQGIIEYLDTSEEEGSLICIEEENIDKLQYTHLEIHPSLIFGVMGNLIAYPENSQLPRDLFSCGQSKQAVSIYHTNFQNRIDKSGLILNSGQIPLIKSRYLKYINNEQHPYGVNAIVAIGIYGSYNVEDSILFNQGAIDRGIFRTTYFNSYESREESSKVGNSTVDSKFANIEENNVIGLKPGYDYANLDEYGLIKENMPANDKTVIIGKISSNLTDPNTYIDDSVSPKKGQIGFVDKSFITQSEEGFRIAKVRIREERIPAIGDKFCSRCGQKGTIGLIIPEQDMPFTSQGIRPDIIINPHALPSRMTISQLIECLAGKACAEYGAFGDATAFANKGPKNKLFGRLLSEVGYSSTGNELLYNGQTGEQLEAEIFIGPTYYMRLKHMVKDKINARAKGPRTVLTRQTVQGRANEGGLRIGEMERDVIVAHGMAKFLYDSLLTRGDNYYMAICNTTGTIAIYNESKNLFMSPLADGPIQFTGLLEDNINIIDITRYGRSFSIVNVPYSFKLLMQELGTMNISLRIITDQNINQIENMAFSRTLNLSLTKETQNIKTPNIDDKKEKTFLPQRNITPVPEEKKTETYTDSKKELQDIIEDINPPLDDEPQLEEKPILDIQPEQITIKPIKDAIESLDKTINKGIQVLTQNNIEDDDLEIDRLEKDRLERDKLESDELEKQESIYNDLALDKEQQKELKTILKLKEKDTLEKDILKKISEGDIPQTLKVEELETLKDEDDKSKKTISINQ